MNKSILLFQMLSLGILLISCSKNSSPTPDLNLDNTTTVNNSIIIQDSTQFVQEEDFYELQNSIEDIQREMAILQTQVLEYEHKPLETDYTKKLKELIKKPPLSHKIYLKNGSIIKGTITEDKLNNLLIDTNLGTLTIKKSEIEKIDDLVIPTANIIFIGHGQEEVFESYRIFSGKIMNQGSRRGDFVRVIYNLWGENTQLIISDSSFVDGPQIIYQSGIVTDTILQPNESVKFNIKFSIPDSINVAYVTRDIRWELYD